MSYNLINKLDADMWKMQQIGFQLPQTAEPGPIAFNHNKDLD